MITREDVINAIARASIEEMRIFCLRCIDERDAARLEAEKAEALYNAYLELADIKKRIKELCR